MLAAKVIEDCRIGGSPLEKSTRYIYFDQKINGEYLYYREPILMTSAYRELYIETCNNLFETYSQLIPPLTAIIEEHFPKEHHISKVAYTASLRAKVLDCLRGILPSSALTNMGMFGNGRFFESLLQKLNCHNLAEMQELGKKGYTELSKIIPSFIRRAEPSHKYFSTFSQFKEEMQGELKILVEEHSQQVSSMSEAGVRLINYESDAVLKVASALLFENSSMGLKETQEYVATLNDEQISKILDAGCISRENRRHKSPRALENTTFTFEVLADFGVYRDLHRHRILTQERQLLSCDYSYFIPSEIIGTDMEEKYTAAMDQAKQAFDTIRLELPEEAQYIVPMAYNIHWYFTVNLRSLQWMCELRSSPAGHPNYRFIAQEMARQVCDMIPQFERFFKFVDYDGYELGRLGQEIRRVEKMET